MLVRDDAQEAVVEAVLTEEGAGDGGGRGGVERKITAFSLNSRHYGGLPPYETSATKH